MLLPWLILIPFIGGFLCWQTERFGVKVPRWIALITMGLTLALSLQLWLQGGYSLTQSAGIPQWQSEFDMPWIPRFGISIHLAIDGLSLLMVVLTGLLGVLAVLCSWKEIEKYQGFFHLNLMWILGGVIGVFLAIDMFLFFFFWEMMLVPMYFLIALWGHKASDGKTRITAATKFFIYTQASGLVMLIAILALVFVHYNATGVWTFNYEELLNTPMSSGVEYLLMLGFFIAFAVKMPVVPLHGWLPDAHSQAPTAGSVDLAGILLKTAVPPLQGVLPQTTELAHGSMLTLEITSGVVAVVGILLAAWLWLGKRTLVTSIANSAPGRLLSTWWYNAWGFDWLYDKVFVKPFLGIAWLLKRDPLNSMMNIPAVLSRFAGKGLLLSENGYLRWYVASMSIGAVVVLALLMVLR